jgi:hypothetical protein
VTGSSALSRIELGLKNVARGSLAVPERAYQPQLAIVTETSF